MDQSSDHHDRVRAQNSILLETLHPTRIFEININRRSVSQKENSTVLSNAEAAKRV